MNEIEILLIEDNPSDVELTLDALKTNHISNRIHVARDGAEALDYIFGSGPAAAPMPKLILLDIKLPKVDGLEVLALLKQDPQTQRIPIVMLTSSREEQDILSSYNLGVNSYIVKPVDFAQFNTAVSTLGMYWMLINEASPK